MPKSLIELPSILIGLVFGEKYDQELIKGPESTSPEVRTNDDDKFVYLTSLEETNISLIF